MSVQQLNLALKALLRARTSETLTPIEFRKKAGELNLLRVDLQSRLGGLDLSASTLVDLFILAGFYDADLRDYIGLGHMGLLPHKSTHKFDNLLKKAAGGQTFTAMAMTEKTGGSDLKSFKTRAGLTQSGYILSGEKTHIARLQSATHAIVFAQIKIEMTDRLTAFLVPLHTEGIKIYPNKPVGLGGQGWGSLVLDNVKIPISNRIGGIGEAFRLFRNHFSKWRLFMAGIAIGIALKACDYIQTRLSERNAFGGPIGRFTHLQQEFAKHTAKVQALRQLLYSCASHFDKPCSPVLQGAMAKAECVEGARDIVDFALSVWGAEGVIADHPLRKMHGHLEALRIADGTTDVLRGQVARFMLGEHLYRMSLAPSGE